MPPKTIIAANWKMNLSIGEAQELGTSLDRFYDKGKIVNEVVLCPTFLQLPALSGLVKNVKLGAQDVYFEEDGAFTGEISTSMLKEVHAEYVIIGHSERRHVLFESEEMIAKKLNKVLSSKLKPIFCLGEKITERKDGKTEEVIKKQLEALSDVDEEKMKQTVIAYEPVWAIGTGINAKAFDAEEVIGFIRRFLEKKYSQETSNQVSILYGGSVNDENIEEFSNSREINGVLVGGASLDEEKFCKIINVYQNKQHEARRT